MKKWLYILTTFSVALAVSRFLAGEMTQRAYVILAINAILVTASWILVRDKK